MDQQQLSVQLDRHWNGLLVSCDDDEMTAGGQSKKELERLEAFEAWIGSCEGMTLPTFHHFAEGTYTRELRAPKDAVIIGHQHRHECTNIMTMGVVLTITNGVVTKFEAPCVVKSGAFTRKASIVVEDMIWLTVHPNPDNETDLSKIEERLFIKSQTFLKHEADRHDQSREV